MKPYTETKTTSWVYITRHTCTGEQLVCHTLDLAGALNAAPHLQLVYYRRYDNIADAMGHKLLLEQLSAPSLRAIIQRTNPHNDDLRKEFQQQSIL